ncbi:DUF6588 family protein [Salinimicrobium marinum]|uniref:DUF6588 family protein n=1 Tax=Salinimicrobium marinum TaxID=680283 RepID=UPI00167ABD4C|nr:DUF6588 family protein [Salinimicrobium marinum]
MKNTLKCTACLVLFCASFSVKAQNDVGLFINDMLKVADDFASPAAEAATFQSGAGWFTTAKSLDLWQVEISVHGNALFVPEDKRTVAISNDNYQTFHIQGATAADIPTGFGGTTDVIFEGQIQFLGQTEDFTFDAIDGIDKKMVAHPFIQASVGLPYHTDLSVRFLPETTIDDISVSTYAVGLKHNFNQYFNFSRPTDFQFAALIAYSKFDVLYEYDPIELERIVKLHDIEVDADLWLFQLLSSKSFDNSGWEFLAAVGVTNSNFNYTMGGSGVALAPLNNALGTLDNNEKEFKGDLGINYNFSDFTISSALSVGKFYNLNLGLHFRL